MPLANYGVLIGTLYTTAEQTEQGNWFHGVYYLSAPGSQYPFKCTTDFSSSTAFNIDYKIFNNLDASKFANISALANGYTELPRNSDSGAIDYVRSPLLGPYGCIEAGVAFFNQLFGSHNTDGWVVSDGTLAVQQLQDQLNLGPQRIFCFGEPFDNASPSTDDAGITSQKGMHNVHMNQGDPMVSTDGVDHQADDGIWQDGCTIFLNADNTLTAFCNKFTSQTFDTGDDGLPTTP